MTESQWLESIDPKEMLAFLRETGRLTDRKARLFAVACCRRIWHLLVDERLREVVAVSEAHADGNADDKDLSASYNAARGTYRTAYEYLTGHPPAEVVSATVTDESGRTGVAAWLSSHPPVEALEAPSPQAAAASAAEAVLRAASPPRLLPWTAYEIAADATAGWWWMTSQRPAPTMAEIMERSAQVALIRDLFAPCQVQLEPSLLTANNGLIPSLARAAYEDRILPEGRLDNARLAVLADALEEAGFEDAGMLSHLRQPDAVHVRGCAVVDWILGRS